MLYKLLFLNAAGEVVKYKYYGNLKTALQYFEYHITWHRKNSFSIGTPYKLKLIDATESLIKEELI